LSVLKLPLKCAVAVTFLCIQLLNSGWSAITVKCLTAWFGFYSLWFFQLSNVFFLLNTPFKKAIDTPI
jgi:hypothetical protein